MKIMHIADLHIGRTLNQHQLLEDQVFMLEQLIDEIDKEKIELLIIAGDIYDRALPSKEAVQVFETFIQKINIDRGLPVLAVSGNHDGATRLGYGKEWFKQHQFHLSTHIADSFQPVTYQNVDFYLIPYVEPAEARLYFEDDIDSHRDSYSRIIDQIRPAMNRDRKSVAVSHLFIQGGKESDSERTLSIGAVEYVPESIFKDFDYVALGHLHHPFAIQSDKVYYSGSLMKYSFSEVQQPKGYRLVTIEEEVRSIFVPLKLYRDMHVIESSYDKVMNNEMSLKQDDYYQFILSDMRHIKDPMTRLKTVYPHVLELRYLEETAITTDIIAEVDKREDIEIIEQFIQSVSEVALSKEQKQTLERLLKEVNDETY
ncbi:exonuclease SbcCD subunit D [Macrococcus brunensis]|uniref:exonuclease SbcCD subunit D n=1 Tax=Macrococcus brunensis TaxID=198483 RepID=UPI001EF10660|nr:exonuclease SbcCD subunit D [Macrococcus brunensis]ULG70927.1 exonuclease SbcCD subunit D [Macrococcus brunensis]